MENEKLYCSCCRRKVNQKVLKEETIAHRDDYILDENYKIIQCLGCDHISFYHENVDMEFGYVNEYGEWEPEVYGTQYPYFIEGHLELKKKHYLPDLVKKIYEETISSLEVDSFILTGIGLRCILETICNDLSIKGGDLKEKITKLSGKGYISKNSAARLHGIRFLGNDAVHETKTPEREAIDVALDIVESLVKEIYIHEKEAQKNMITGINQYADFEKLLLGKLKRYKKGQVLILQQLLGKDYKRIIPIKQFEIELIKNINKKKFPALNLGGTRSHGKGSLQEYIIN